MENKLVSVVIIIMLGVILFASIKEKPSTIAVTTSEGIKLNTVTVTGMSDLSVDPDQAIAYLSISTDGATAKEAQQKNNVVTEKVNDALRKSGIAKEDIETETYYLNTKSHWNPVTGESLIDGYTQMHNLKVTVNDLGSLGAIIDEAVKAGVNNINNVMFDLSKKKKKEINGKALGIAALEAKGKAENLAESLGVRLGKLVSISEANYAITPYYAEVSAMMDSGGVMASPKADLSPKKVNVNLNVNLVYEIA